MRSSSRSPVKGFAMSSAPASSIADPMPGPAKPDMKRTGSDGRIRQSSSASWSPRMPGITMSVSRRSIRPAWASAASSAAAALSAARTVYPARARIRRVALRRASSSSTSRIVRSAAAVAVAVAAGGAG